MTEINRIAGRREDAGVIQFGLGMLAVALFVVAIFQTAVVLGVGVTPTLVWKSMVAGAAGWVATALGVWGAVFLGYFRGSILTPTVLTISATVSVAGLFTLTVVPFAIFVNALLAIVAFAISVKAFKGVKD